MKTFSITPIDVVSPSGEWFSTYRYEPFLDKWFYITPQMHARVSLMDTSDIPTEISSACPKEIYQPKFSYYAPLKLQIQLNKSCNYRCAMCYAYNENKRNEYLPRKNLSSFLLRAKTNGVLRINYVGGEVFMRKDFPEIVDETFSNRMLVSCISNGIIPGSRLDLYQDTLKKLFNIQVSCNGIGSSYEREYGGVLPWKKAAKCIENVIRATETNILSFVISESNYLDIPQFLAFANSIKPSVVKFGTICWEGNSKTSKSYNYYKTILPKAKILIEEGRNKYSNLLIQSQLDQGTDSPLWEDFQAGYRPFEFYFSPEGKDGLYIKSDGDIYPFPLLSNREEFRIGTITDDLKALWQSSPVLQQLRSATFEKTDCFRCGCNSICGLWNRSYAYSWTNDLLGKVPCKITDWK